tara:strand:- start:244 stop:819 length:576 start_codon:yes stop_codon:yes gene_type:complete
MKATEIVKQIKEVLGIELSEEKVVLATMKLDNGTEIEAESFEPGKEVFIVSEEDEKIALPVGEYTLEDGQALVVTEEGLIDSIGAEEVVEEEAKEEVETETVEATEEVYATKEELAEVKTMIEEIKAIFEKQDLSSEPVDKTEEKTEDIELAAETVEPITHNPEALSSQKEKQSTYPKRHIDLIRQMINNK